jgi:autophagy-related protein 11
LQSNILTFRLALNEATAYNEAAEQLHELQGQQEAQEQIFGAERKALQSRINELDSQNNQLNAQLPQLENEIDHLQALLKQARTSVEQTHGRYEEAQVKNQTYEQDLRQRNSEISKMLDQLEQDEHAQRALRMEKTEMSEMARVQGERLETANRNIAGHLERISTLEKDVSSRAEENKILMRRDDESKQRIETLETQLRQARAEGDDAKGALKDAVRERDRLLRDHRVEADGDRAVLEHRFHETRNQLESDRQQLQEVQQKFSATASQLSSLRSQNAILQADLSSLREELQRTSHELAVSTQAENLAQQTENTLRAELNFANNALVQVEGKLERTERILAQVFDVAIAFRNSHAKALAQAQVMLRPIGARVGLGGGAAMGESTILTPGLSGGMDIGSPPRGQIVGSLGLQGTHAVATERPSSPTPIDPSDPLTALDTLREFDLDAFAETIAKTGLTIRKWQKQCKEYRERAKGKISFRNFQKGDLALFLPTRNSVARPWAAFNSAFLFVCVQSFLTLFSVSFPHYFLSATGHVAEQLKTREWIVARITSIAERVVDSNVRIILEFSDIPF